MTKFTLNKSKNTIDYWNGNTILPNEINVISYHPIISEFELLSLICTLHGNLTPFDILTGANSDTEKDNDITSVMTAFQMYIYPKMPLSNYSNSDKRIKSSDILAKVKAIDIKN